MLFVNLRNLTIYDTLSHIASLWPTAHDFQTTCAYPLPIIVELQPKIAISSKDVALIIYVFEARTANFDIIADTI